MNKIKIMSLILTAALALPQITVLAVEPMVSTDEAVYVNMDYYGQTTDVSVVKSCNLNGVRQFSDFGDYKSVVNMSNHIEPVLEEGKVTWDLADIDCNNTKNCDRFYYECKLNDNNSLVLPWSFDVGYKLNGVPYKGEDLAGKAGTVEITVHAIPNKNAGDYAKNNMILQVATAVNMDETLSIEAPGSQIQALGAHKAVVFAALPGEDITFTIRIGTNSFESTGVNMMMMPATLSQMEDIKDIKESKDKVEDAANAVKDSMDDIIDTMQSMSAGLDITKEGLAKLDEGRSSLKEDREGVFEASDIAIEDITNLTDNISSLVPHMQEGQRFVADVNTQANGMNDTLSSTKKNIKEYQKLIKDIQTNVKDLQDGLEKADGYRIDRRAVFEKLRKSLGEMEGPLGWMQKDSQQLGNEMDDLRQSSKNLKNVIDLIADNPITDKVMQGSVGDSLTEDEWLLYQAGIKGASGAANRTASDASGVMGQATSLLQSMEVTLDHGKDAANALQNLVGLTDIYIRIMEDNYSSTQAMINDINEIGSATDNVLTKLSRLITQTDELNDILNTYEPSLQSLLTDLADLAAQLNTSVLSSLNFLTSFQAALRRSEGSLDEGMQNALVGMTDVLNEAIKGIAKSDTIKNANNIIKDTIDNEIDRFEQETNVLNMDGDLPRQSFTSSQNPEPESIQIILRTQEISIDDDENLNDLETPAVDLGVKGRISMIFHKLWEKITGLFS